MNKIGLISFSCFFLLKLYSVSCWTSSNQNVLPLNLEQWISKFHADKLFHESNQGKEFISRLIDYNPSSEMLYDTFANIASSDSLDTGLASVNQECSQQFINFTEELLNKNSWAIQVFDAFGKPTSGIFQGSIYWLGEYSECIRIKEPEWKGKYCKLTDKIQFGMCLPQTCTENDVVHLVNFVIGLLPGNFSKNLIGPSNVLCQEDKSLDIAAIGTLFFIGLILFIAVWGTSIDLYRILQKNLKSKKTSDYVINDEETQQLIVPARKEPVEEPLLFKILLSFSLYTNSKKIFNISNMEGQLECLNGIRYLSIGWVILGHTFAFLFGFADNSVVFAEWISRFSFQAVSNATPSVDSFFLMSGLLTAYLFMKETSKGNWLNFNFMFKYYIHRYIRLTPPLMIAIMINLNLSKYYGNGPQYPKDGLEIPDCRTTWQWNLLYINNFFDSSKMCLGQSWYLANDMQFHWFAPIILIPFALNLKIKIFNLNLPITQILGLMISALFIIACIISRALIIKSHPGFEIGILNPEQGRFMDLVYVKPWSRMGPFIVGLLLGYFIYLHKTKQIRINIKKELIRPINLVLWCASITLLGILLYGLYGDFNGHPLTREQHIWYQATFRILWSVGLSYIIFACLNSQGGFINEFLSWKIWIPLARLSYSAYLVHIAVINYYINTSEHPFHFQDFNMALNFISILVVSFVVAFVFSLLFELPILSLEKIIFKRK